MKKALFLLLAGSLLLGSWRLWAAASDSPKEPKNLKPVVVVSLAGYDKMLDNVAMLGKAAGNPELAKELIVVLKLVAIQQGMAAPDKARPWGVVVQADGDALTGCAFLPAPDLANLAETMAPLVGKAEKVGDGVYKVRSSTKPVYVKQQDGWAFFAYNIEAFDALPADPIALLAGLNAQYDAAVRFYPANIPAKRREEFAAWLKTRVEPYACQQSCEPDCIYRVRKQLTEQVLQPTLAAVNDTNTVTVGWTLDTTAKKTYVELGVTAKEGSATAQTLASVFGVKSQFSGFRLPGAALTGNWAVQIPPQKSAKVNAFVDAFRVLAVEDEDPENKDKAKGAFKVAARLVADLADLIRAGVGSGCVDGGMALMLQPDAVTALTGGYVADGAKLADAVRLIAATAARKNPGIAEWIKLDAAQLQSVHIHTLSIPIPADVKNREEIVSLIGQRFEVAVGVGEKSAFVATGRKPLEAIEQVIEQSAADIHKNDSSVEFSLAAGPTAKFIAAASPIENVRCIAKMVALGLDPSAGRDHLKLIAGPIPNGVKYRLEAEEGVLCLLGRLSTAATGEEKQK